MFVFLSIVNRGGGGFSLKSKPRTRFSKADAFFLLTKNFGTQLRNYHPIKCKTSLCPAGNERLLIRDFLIFVYIYELMLGLFKCAVLQNKAMAFLNLCAVLLGQATLEAKALQRPIALPRW